MQVEFHCFIRHNIRDQILSSAMNWVYENEKVAIDTVPCLNQQITDSSLFLRLNYVSNKYESTALAVFRDRPNFPLTVVLLNVENISDAVAATVREFVGRDYPQSLKFVLVGQHLPESLKNRLGNLIYHH